MRSQIKKWGNSAAVRLNKDVLTKAGMRLSSPVKIHVQDEKIVIEAVKKVTRNVQLPFVESDLLEGLDAHSAHAD